MKNNPFQCTSDLVCRMKRLALEFIRNYRRPGIAKTILKKKEKAGGFHFPVSKLTTATVIETVCY